MAREERKLPKTIPLFTVNMPTEVDKPLLEVLHSGYIGQGKKVEEFETALGNFLETKNVLTLNSGTSALQLALRLANVNPGDEVISTPMTCSATNEPILACGGKIVWADINPKNGLISPKDVERKVTPKTKAIVCVDWGGSVCDLDELMHLGDKYNLKIIEDAAHAFGAGYKGKMVGTIADFTCFSFQAIKHITTVDGGLLVTKNDKDYKRGKLLRWYGIDREATSKDSRIEQDISEWGYKFHMNDVAATIGLVQLGFIKAILEKHQNNAEFYHQTINHDFYTHPRTDWDQDSAFWLYTILLPTRDKRDRFRDFMAENMVMTSEVHSRNDIHATFREFVSDLPGVKYFSERHIAIPVHAKLTTKDRNRISVLSNEFAEKENGQNVQLQEVANLKDALIMARIRNECRLFMTHDTRRIELDSQRHWFENIYKQLHSVREMTCYLFYKTGNSNPIGYGVIKKSNEKYWLTGGLLKKDRGQGYGRKLFQLLINNTPGKEIWLSVLESNSVASGLYEKLGFKPDSLGKNDIGKNLVVMRLQK